MALIKVKPWGKDQGDYVLIDEKDFNKDVHVAYEEPKKKAKLEKEEA